MSKKDNGGPAFPFLVEGEDDFGQFKTQYEGISMRDYFAAKAMQAMVTKYGYISGEVDDMARFAHDIADAMLQERAK